jgi:aconitate hydratase
MTTDIFKTLSTLQASGTDYRFFQLDKLPGGESSIHRLPMTIRILLEDVVRHADGISVTEADVLNLLHWQTHSSERIATPFYPSRVIMQDFSGVPVMNDLAAMRAALVRKGGKPEDINPMTPVDLVIDHSIQVDYYGSPDSLQLNTQLEFQRNKERYEFLHWCQKAFSNLKVVPPSSGIIHQVNLENLANVVQTRTDAGETLVYPETQVGTDSHTTMINGLGVLGWGVGGIEAVAAMLGEPIEIVTPDVIGVKLSGELSEGVTPTDLTLTIVQMLRKQSVVDKFVEFYGPGISSLSLADRAMIANMSPETGATMVYFPVDAQTLEYMRLTGRTAELVDLVEKYAKIQHLFRTDQTPDPEFTTTLSLDLSTVEPSMAGPKRPQDRVPLRAMKQNFRESLTRLKTERGFGLPEAELNKKAPVRVGNSDEELGHGSVIIAAITSCTNTSNPYVMIAAGLLAKKAVAKGLTVRPYVKTSLAPGSRVVTAYLEKANLLTPLAQLGFNLVGYGCTTCIGNSGPIDENIARVVTHENLVAAAVLSGNRNFEGRVHPNAQANYLASPPLVVAYALAGTVDIDLTSEPIGTGKDGIPVYLRDVWPSSDEIQTEILANIKPALFAENYGQLFTNNQIWNQIESGSNLEYEWDANSTYLQEPPFFDYLDHRDLPLEDIVNARVLALFGDSITTDHISPAGSIPAKSPAGKYLIENGVQVSDFNSYGTRRGNDRVLTRGTFANIRIKNLLLGGVEGSFALHLPDGKQQSIYETAMQYRQEGTPLLVIAGKEYGTGSSRDWAAKGAQQLGVRAILAESYERIHRSNLAGMGILPLQYLPGENAGTHQLTGKETYTVEGLEKIQTPGGEIKIGVMRENGENYTFTAKIRLDTMNEIRYFHNGGLLNWILINKLPA